MSMKANKDNDKAANNSSFTSLGIGCHKRMLPSKECGKSPTLVENWHQGPTETEKVIESPQSHLHTLQVTSPAFQEMICRLEVSSYLFQLGVDDALNPINNGPLHFSYRLTFHRLFKFLGTLWLLYSSRKAPAKGSRVPSRSEAASGFVLLRRSKLSK